MANAKPKEKKPKLDRIGFPPFCEELTDEQIVTGNFWIPVRQFANWLCVDRRTVVRWIVNDNKKMEIVARREPNESWFVHGSEFTKRLFSTYDNQLAKAQQRFDETKKNIIGGSGR